MPKQLIFGLLIESALLFSTIALLVQPSFIVQFKSDRTRRFASAGGWLFLCITFCWSFLLGCLLVIHGYDLKLPVG